MGRFYAEIQGSRGSATRKGTKKSGIRGHIRGWHLGVKVKCYVNEYGNDVCQVWLTGGSSNPIEIKYLGEFVEPSVAVAQTRGKQ